MKKLLLVSTFLLMSLNSELHSAEPQTVEEYLALYGKWGSGMYSDEFGDKTNNGYMSQIIRGTFSNSATQNSPLRVHLYISDGDVMENDPFFRFYEYDRDNPIKGSYGYVTLDCKMKNQNNEVFNTSMYIYEGEDYAVATNGKWTKMFKELIADEGSARFLCVDRKSKTLKYVFRFDFHGYNAKLKQYNDDLKST